MRITTTLIKSVAESYTRDELLQLRKQALEALAEMDYISSATTGAGAGYNLSERAKAEELVELYSAAIDVMDGREPESGAAVYRIRFV